METRNRSRINDLSSLLREKDRLKMSLAQKEKDLAITGSFFGQHYKSIIWSKINPIDGKNALSMVWEGVKTVALPNMLSLNIDEIKAGELKGEQSLPNIAGILAVKLAKKIFKKKDSPES